MIWIILIMWITAMPAFAHSYYVTGSWEAKTIPMILLWPIIGIVMGIGCLFYLIQGKNPFDKLDKR